MMVLVLKAQTNHFAYLDIEIREDMKVLNEDMDMRFDLMREEMDKRFETLTTRIDCFMICSFAATLTVGGIVLAVLKYLP